jgi:protocatechuate 3,4-dioxygenase beta subunit
MKGVRIVVTGVVRLASCQPVPRALIDVWHADDRGDYDNAGYRLRGHQLTDDQGHYRLETIVPGVYPGRTRHFHLKIQAPKGPVLTTQLYFPGEAANASDPIFKRELVLRVRDGAEGKTGTFDFVLRA